MKYIWHSNLRGKYKTWFKVFSILDNTIIAITRTRTNSSNNSNKKDDILYVIFIFENNSRE